MPDFGYKFTFMCRVYYPNKIVVQCPYLVSACRSVHLVRLGIHVGELNIELHRNLLVGSLRGARHS